MQLSCSSESFNSLIQKGEMSLESYISYAAKTLKLTHIELESGHFTPAQRDNPAIIKKRLQDNGIQLANLAFFCSFGFPTEAENEAELTRAIQWMDIAKILGSMNFRIFAGWMHGPCTGLGFSGEVQRKPVEAWETMLRFVQRACAEAKKRGLPVVIENHNHGGFLSQSGDVLRLFQDLPPQTLTLLLDTGNYADGISGIERTIHLAPRYVHLKAKDIAEDGQDARYPVDFVVNILKKQGFSGTLSIEYEGEQDPRACIPWLLARLRTLIAL